MLTPKDLGIVIVKVTSTYITSIICGNVGFLAGTIALDVANP
jgi:hypothetical protein